MKREEILGKLRQDMVHQITIEHHIQGVRKLFDATVACGNNRQAELYRQQLHDLLDQQLDLAASVLSLTSELVRLTGDEG